MKKEKTLIWHEWTPLEFYLISWISQSDPSENALVVDNLSNFLDLAKNDAPDNDFYRLVDNLSNFLDLAKWCPDKDFFIAWL